MLTLTFTAENGRAGVPCAWQIAAVGGTDPGGELGCVDGETRVPLWRQSGEVGKIAPDLLRRDNVPTALRSNVTKFFAEFVRDAKRRSPGSLRQ